jgi:hypothetical protein
MENIESTEGVVAKLNGKFWGNQRQGDSHRQMGWGPIENADISNPEFCKKPTDMTYNPANTNGYNPDYNELSKPGVKLVPVKKTIRTEYDFTFHSEK